MKVYPFQHLLVFHVYPQIFYFKHRSLPHFNERHVF
jgi:hypothetical protein